MPSVDPEPLSYFVSGAMPSYPGTHLYHRNSAIRDTKSLSFYTSFVRDRIFAQNSDSYAYRFTGLAQIDIFGIPYLWLLRYWPPAGLGSTRGRTWLVIKALSIIRDFLI